VPNLASRVLALRKSATRTGFVFAVISTFILASISVPRLAAQSSMACHTMQTRGEVPPEQLPPPQKLTGIGNAHIAITANPEAQMWFDQGLNLLHDFWDYESLRAFEQGVRSDPNCAMCYWGIYHAEIFNHSNGKYYAKQALAKAMSLRKQVGEAERLYIVATAKSEKGKSKDVKVYRKLVKKYPNDLQARIFLANTVGDGYNDKGEPNKGEKERFALLQDVLKEDPDNSAANHYWIHAVEDKHPDQALHSAEVLGKLAPTSGHMVHMPGHIFYRVGDYARAEQVFAASTEADEQYMQSQNVNVDNDWNYVHNLMYAVANLLEAGKLEEATGLSAKLIHAHGELANSLYPWSTRDSISRIEVHLPVALRSADWKTASELLTSAQVPDTLPNIQFLQRGLKSFAAGMQALEQGEITQAETASTNFEEEIRKATERAAQDAKSRNKGEDKTGKKVPQLPVAPDAEIEPLTENLSIMSLELRAGILIHKKQADKAKELFEQAAKKEKDLGYHEPPAYVRPVAENEAAALLSVSDWAGARAAYKKALEDRPRSGFPLYGLAFISEQSGDTKSASTEYADFLSAWKSADAALPQVAHAKEFLAAHGAVASR